MKKFYCHTTLVCDWEEEPSVTKGNTYEIIQETADQYWIINDLEEVHYFSKELGDKFTSFDNWLELIDSKGENK